MFEQAKTVPTLRIFADEPGSLTCSLCGKAVPCGLKNVDQRFAVVSHDVCICDHSIAGLAVQYLQFVEERMLRGEAPAVAEEFLKRLFHETFLAKYFAAVGNCPVGFMDIAGLEERLGPLVMESEYVQYVRGVVDRTFCEDNRIFPLFCQDNRIFPELKGKETGYWAFRALGEDDLPSLEMWQAAVRASTLLGLPNFLRVNHPDFQALLDKYYPVPVARTTFDETKSTSYSWEEIVAAVDESLFAKFHDDADLYNQPFFLVRMQDDRLVVVKTQFRGLGFNTIKGIFQSQSHARGLIELTLPTIDWHLAVKRLYQQFYPAERATLDVEVEAPVQPASVAEPRFDETKSTSYSWEEIVTAVDQSLFAKFHDNVYLAKELFFPVRMQDDGLVVVKTRFRGLTSGAVCSIFRAQSHARGLIELTLPTIDWHLAVKRLYQRFYPAEGATLDPAGGKEKRRIAEVFSCQYTWEELQAKIDVTQSVFERLSQAFCANHKVFPVRIEAEQGFLVVATATRLTDELRATVHNEASLRIIVDILVDSEETIHKALERWGWLLGKKSFVVEDLDGHLELEVVDKFPLGLCLEYEFFPIRMEGDQLIVVTPSGKLTSRVESKLKFFGYTKVGVLRMSRSDVDHCIRLFGKRPAKAVPAESAVVPPVPEVPDNRDPHDQSAMDSDQGTCEHDPEDESASGNSGWRTENE